MNTRTLLMGLLVLLCHYRGIISDVIERTTDPVAQLTSQVAQLTSQLTEVQSDLNSKNDQISDLRNDLSHQAALITNLTHTLNTRGSKLDYLDTYSRNNIEHFRTRLVNLEHDVAFTVQFSNDSVGDLITNANFSTNWKILKFDCIRYQAGGDNYNTSTGLFTAPVDGTYAFFLTIQRSDPLANSCLEAIISRGYNTYIAVISACPDGYTSSSNMGVTRMRKGDTVRVQTLRSSEILGYFHTTFTGFQIN